MKRQHFIYSTLLAVMVAFAMISPAMADPEPAASGPQTEASAEMQITLPAYFDIQLDAEASNLTLAGSENVAVTDSAVQLKNAINVEFDVTTNDTVQVDVTIKDSNNVDSANANTVAFTQGATTANVAVADAVSSCLGADPAAASNPGAIAFAHTLKYNKNGGALTDISNTYDTTNKRWRIGFDPGVGTIVFNIAAGNSIAGTYSTQDPVGTYSTTITATKVAGI